jgi:hypothetical protein
MKILPLKSILNRINRLSGSIVLLLLLLMLGGCGPNPTPTPTPNLQPIVETVVQATLAAIPTATPLPTETPIPPTNTSEPPTPTPFTPTSTATPVTPTATSIPNDPAVILGQPSRVDHFDNSNNWTLFDEGCFKSEITGGQYVMTHTGTQGYACWEMSWEKVKNFYLQTLVIMPESCQANDSFGMILRAPDFNQGYLFGLTCDGRFGLERWDGEKTKVLIPPGNNAAILVGGGQTNRIGVMAEGSKLTLYANGVLLGEAIDDKYVEEGLYGYFVSGTSTEPFTVRFDDLSVWKLED